MSFIVVGTSHKYSPIALREKISFSQKRLKHALNFLSEMSALKGAIILSTCNRVEIYAATEDLKAGKREIEDFISCYHELEREEFIPYLYIKTSEEAIRHLFSVTAGLDSLIMGETQIFGQVKSSLQEAQELNFVDDVSRRVFNSAFAFAKRIHSQTGISAGKVSVGSIAIEFIRQSIGSLSGKNILIVGAGKVSELVLKYLKKEDPNVIFLSNRTFEKVKVLAGKIGAKAVRFNELGLFLNKADVVITATRSPHFIIKKDTLKGKIGQRLLIIDLALPRDVDPQVKEIENVDLFTLEDLSLVIEKNRQERLKEAKRCQELLNLEVEIICQRHTELEQELALLP